MCVNIHLMIHLDAYYSIYCFETGDYCTSDGSPERTPSASVIKVLIMEYAQCLNAKNELDLQETLHGDTINGLVVRMIQQSDNEATNILIDYFGMDNLNAYFMEQGYKDTELQGKMLGFDSRISGKESYT